MCDELDAWCTEIEKKTYFQQTSAIFMNQIRVYQRRHSF
jgi:hypothetical protein